MHYHPPRMEGVPQEKFEIYKDVINGAYRFHDMMLQTLLDLAGPDTTVVLVSDHGFHSDHLRPRAIPNEPAGPAVQHRRFGILCMKGDHIQQDERIYGATLLDITPTILTLFGLPVGEDMDGRVLVQAFEGPPQITRIPSWETEPGESGMHPADLRMDPAAAQAVLQQFVALGYIQPPSEDQARAAETALREQQYNLARVYLNSQRIAEAQTIFEQLTIKWPDESRFLQHFAQCALAQGHHEQAKTLLYQLIAFKPKAAPARNSDPPTATERPGPADAATNSQPRAWVALLMGTIHFEEGDLDAALACLQRAEQSDSHLPDLHLRIGETYLRQKRTHDAERAFQRALEIDGDCAEAHLGLALVHLRQRHNENAAEQALLAVGLQHFLPLGHFYLGIALARLGHYDRAVLAFETSLTMHPGLIAAHRWLAALYTRPGGDLGKAVRHREILLRIRRQPPALSGKRLTAIARPPETSPAPQLAGEPDGEKRKRSRGKSDAEIPPPGRARGRDKRKHTGQKSRTQHDLVFVLRPRKAVYETVSSWRAEQRHPEQHNQDHSDNAQQMRKLASHLEVADQIVVAILRQFKGPRARFLRDKSKKLLPRDPISRDFSHV